MKDLSHNQADALSTLCTRHVRLWHLADIAGLPLNVRFKGQSGHDLLQRECPLVTQSGHRLALNTNFMRSR